MADTTVAIHDNNEKEKEEMLNHIQTQEEFFDNIHTFLNGDI